MSYDYPPPVLPPGMEFPVCLAAGVCLLAAWCVLWLQTAWQISGWRFAGWLLGGALMMGIVSLVKFSPESAHVVHPLMWATTFSGALAALLPSSESTARRNRIVTFLFLVTFGALFTWSAPSLLGARAAAERTTCRTNLKQIHGALQRYESTLKFFAQPVSHDPLKSWRVHLFLWFNIGPMSWDYDDTKPWDATPNDQLAFHRKTMYTCPADRDPIDPEGRWYTAYAMLTGPGTLGQPGRKLTPQDVTDGMATTIAVVEACGAKIIWTEPRDIDVAVQPAGINLPGESPGTSRGWLSSCHSGGAHALMADGSVRFVSQQINDTVLRGLATIAGDETVTEF
ncbi:MAG: DUF1559 domain-containing protein [Planctomycetaceae bacterium]